MFRGGGDARARSTSTRAVAATERDGKFARGRTLRRLRLDLRVHLRVGRARARGRGLRLRLLDRGRVRRFEDVRRDREPGEDHRGEDDDQRHEREEQRPREEQRHGRVAGVDPSVVIRVVPCVLPYRRDGERCRHRARENAMRALGDSATSTRGNATRRGSMSGPRSRLSRCRVFRRRHATLRSSSEACVFSPASLRGVSGNGRRARRNAAWELRLRSVRLSVRSLSAVNSPEFTTEIEFIGFLNATRSTRADLFESNFDRDSRSQRKTKRGGVAGGAGDAPAREITEKTRKESLSLDEFIDRAAIRTTVLLHHRPHPLPPSRLNPPLFFAFFSLCAR